MNIFDGLLSYEVVLLVLGVLLFVVLTGLLIYSVMKQRPTASIATLFVLPVLMVGFPSVQKFKFDNWEVDVNRAAETAANNPADPAAQKTFEDAANNLDVRRVTNPALLTSIADTRLKIAQAQIAAGQHEKALQNVNSALELRPHAEIGVQLRQRLMMERPTK